MTLPGPVIEERQAPPPRSAPADVGKAFLAGFTEKGPLVATAIRSKAQYDQIFGVRTGNEVMADSVETILREGGSLIYVGREVGVTPVKATVSIFDQAGSTAPGDVALVATALNPGAWENGLNVAITVNGGNFTVNVTHDTDTTVSETSGEVADRQAAIDWSANSAYLRLTAGASNEDPRAASYSLAGGTDDRGTATDAQRLAALNLFTKDLGAGKVAVPGQSTQVTHQQLFAHAKANNRSARADLADTATVATLTAAAALIRADANVRYGGLFTPRATIPGLVSGTTRTVPYSAVQIGIEAYNLAHGKTAGDASAGDLGKARYARGLSQAAFTDADRETLNNAGVNVARITEDGFVTTYGFETPVDPAGTAAKQWLGLQKADAFMQIAAESRVIAEAFEFRTIDGKGHVAGELAGRLTNMLARFYTAGIIFGQTFADAATVDVGDAVNTPQTIAAQELHAELAVRLSEHADRVIIGISNVPVTESV